MSASVAIHSALLMP